MTGAERMSREAKRRRTCCCWMEGKRKVRGSRKKKGSDREERVVDSTRYLTSASLSSAETVTTVEGGRDAIKEEREVDARSSLGVMLDFFRNN